MTAQLPDAHVWPEGLARVCPRCDQAVAALPGGLVCQECAAALLAMERRAREVAATTIPSTPDYAYISRLRARIAAGQYIAGE